MNFQKNNTFDLCETHNTTLGMQAMIFAAGLGTRLQPFTLEHPKALYPVGGKPLLQHCIEALKASGVSRIVINIHHFADRIVDFVEANKAFGVDIRFSDERHQLLETGGGIRHAIPHFRADEPILIHNVDMLTNINLSWLIHQFNHTDCDALLLVNERDSNRKLIFNAENRLIGWTNQKTGEIKSPYPPDRFISAQYYSFSGIHIFSPRLFDQLREQKGAFSIIDFYLSICSEARINAIVCSSLKVMDVGKMADAKRAEQFLQTLCINR